MKELIKEHFRTSYNLGSPSTADKQRQSITNGRNSIKKAGHHPFDQSDIRVPMLNGRNIQDILIQAAKPVSTTSKSILGVAVTLPNGSLLSSHITNEKALSITNLKMYALYAQRVLKENQDGKLEKFVIEEEENPLELYVQLIPKTEYGIIIITDVGYPDGLISLKNELLLENLKELEKFVYTQED